MTSIKLEDLQMLESWYEGDPETRFQFAFPVFAATGAKESALVYFEVEPERAQALHKDGAEEVLVVLDGEAEVVMGEERVRVSAGSVVVIPEMVPHQVRNAGSETVRCLGFLPSANPKAHFSEPIMPLGAKDIDMPVFDDAPLNWNEVARRLGGG